MKSKIFIDGEHGTTGLQIRTRLAQRNDIEVISIPEEERRNKDMRADFLRAADIAILCLPDDASREAVALLEGYDTRIIDTSTAHRTHESWVYGFAELEKAQAERIKNARFVANPGCYPTGAISLIRPLRDAGLLAADYPISINAVSGYTGGGKQMIAQMEDPHSDNPITANNFLYGLNLRHKHVPELQLHGRLEKRPIFAPSVGRFAQGMIVQVPLFLEDMKGAPSLKTIHAALSDHYSDQDIIQVVSLEDAASAGSIDAEELAGSDNLKIYCFGTEGDGQANLVAVLDNLGKGASGAAVQNMNLMLQK